SLKRWNISTCTRIARKQNKGDVLTREYLIEGMSCSHCVARVKNALLTHPDVIQAEVTLHPPRAIITLKQPVNIEHLQQLVNEAGDYTIKPN
ncbi:MAG TPA: heavy metal-associated domain-containing protein, partial [Chitinophagales bacterium]|nr:heavy metal-associated domain-containing protein [Chitinophagales bacterium]